MFVRPDIDVLFNFLAAGSGVRLEVKVHNPGVEDEAHGREGRFGERGAAIANENKTVLMEPELIVFPLVFTE